MLKTPLTAILIAVAGLGAACQKKSSGLSDYEIPRESTASYQAQQLAKSDSLVRDAQRLEVAGKHGAALEKYQLAIAAYNENPIAWHNAGLQWARLGKNLEAAQAFMTASELAPTDPRPLYELGALWEELGYLDDAARWYDQALQRDPRHQNSLRRAILVDELRHRLTPITAERLKIAIVAERQPWWINRFQRIHQLMTEREPYNFDDNAPSPAREVESIPADESITLPGVEPRRPRDTTSPTQPAPAQPLPGTPPAPVPVPQPAPAAPLPKA